MISDPQTIDTLKKQEIRHRKLLEALPDMLFVYDRHGIQIGFVPSRDWNPVVPPEAFLNKSVMEVLPADIATRILAAIHKTLDTNEMQLIEYQLELEGTVCDYEARLVPSADDEVTAIVRDVTISKQAVSQLHQQAATLERALQELQRTQSQMVQAEKMSSLGQLVAGVAHEINNPVNFIYGNLVHANDYTQDLLQLLTLYQQHYPTPVAAIQEKMGDIDLDFLVEDLPQLLRSMKVGAERIQGIVTSLRNFSRMDESEQKAVNIHDGIDSTLMILQSRLKPKHDQSNIMVTKHYGEIPLIECYPGALNQVFMNILSNAIDALESSPTLASAKKPTITISTELITHHVSPYIRIRFADNGPGIPSHIQPRLFDPFFTTKPVGKGTGMGLSISYQIVTEKHGGLLYCASHVEEGTEFIIELPL